MVYGGETYLTRTKAGIWIGVGLAVMLTFIILAIIKSDSWLIFITIGLLGGLWIMGGELFSIVYDGTARASADSYRNWDTLIKGHPSTSTQAAHAKHTAVH